MNALEGWRLLALSLLTVIGVAVYHLQYGELVVMTEHQFQVELTTMGLDGYREGGQACHSRYHGRLRNR